ncbi:MAG: 2-oxoacid:ferredoxin oxidoreductase subunit beta [Candidatus Zixiibacteriota bacterium]|nr:MAG: 2-oxoacid:ferredoxin oxidoreductase subunit beta [candidate division Zixibacteria bacterium]
MSIQVERPAEEKHPKEKLLRMDRIPHIWCPTCGLGTTVTAMASALEQLELDLNNVAVVSGIGCTGRVAGYMKLDSFHTTHGRAIPFALGLQIARPDMKVIVFSGDGDLISIGGNHFIHTARRNVDITVICVNNFIYAMTGGQVAPTTPITARTATSPFGNYEHPFNLPLLAASSGAVYVARWTALHIRRLTTAIKEAITKKGFSFVEVVAPCSTLYARLNKLGTGLDLMRFYHDNSVIKHGADVREVDVDYQSKIVVGKFLDIEKPTYIDCVNDGNKRVFGDKYKPYGGNHGDN